MDFGGWMRTAVGGLAWIGLFLVPLPEDGLAGITRLLLFALLVLTPPGLALARPRSERVTNLFRTAQYLQPFAALIAAASFLITPGVLAGTLAIAWLPVTALLALDALRRIRIKGVSRIEEFCTDIGLIYLPVSAVLLWMSRMGLQLFGQPEPAALLAAIHVQYAGFAACVLAGLAGRALRSAHSTVGGLFGLSAALVLPGPLLVAAAPLLERSSAAVLGLATTLGSIGLALVLLSSAAQQISTGLPRSLLRLSGLTLLLAAGLAGVNAAGDATRTIYVSDQAMFSTHGWLMAAGFTCCGLLAWALAETENTP